MHGGVGWQGIVPNRAAKMGSIAVDKGIAKLGTASDFYQQLEPEQIAEHVTASARDDVHDVVERIMEREHAQLWHDLPPQMREAVQERVQEQLPEIVEQIVTEEIADNIDQILDPKLMVIRHMEAHPELANRVFEDVGKRELRLMINFGFIFGFLLGIPVIFIVEALPVLVGAADLRRDRRLDDEPLGHAADLRAGRAAQDRARSRCTACSCAASDEVADVYAGIIAEDIVTLANIGDHLLYGPRSDRTRQMLETALRPAVDRATGPARSAVRVAVGTREYDTIRDSVATEAVEYTMTPFTDPEFNRRQGGEDQGAVRRADARAAVPRLRRAAALGDQGGRVDALRPRRRARLRRRPRFTWRSSGSEPMSDEPTPHDDARRGSDRRGAGPARRRRLVADRPLGRRHLACAPAREPARARVDRDGPESADAGRRPARRRADESARQPTAAVAARTRRAACCRPRPTSHYEQGSHPAYERILSDLAPDEARILRLLAERGPAAGGRRPRRARLRPRLAPDRSGLHDDRRRGGLPLRRPGPGLPQQPQPARPDLVLARADHATTSATRCSRSSPTCSRRSTRPAASPTSSAAGSA